VTRDVVLVDPYPRTLDQIFATDTRVRLESLADVVWHDGPPASDDLVEAHLDRLTAIIGQTALPHERLERAPRLRAVLNVEGNFLPNVAYETCFARGIHVLCASPVFGPPVAELALGLALAAARDIPAADADIRAGREELFGGANENAFLLSGATLGLLGCGNLGQALLPLLRPFGGALLVHDPWLQDAVVRDLGAEPVGLDELFGRSRVVFVLAAVTTENRGVVGRRQLESMEPGSVVVLVARSPLVDWDALLDVARSGRLRVALDVFPDEPIPAADPVRRLPHSVLSAHRAGNVPEIWPRIGEMVVDDLDWILRGLPPRLLQAARPETVGLLRSRPIG
jgi:phosphoglycerate dehydrogenase-like enzyme